MTKGRGGAIGTAWALRALRAGASSRLRSALRSLSASAAAMAPVVSMAPREAWAPGLARGPRGTGSCAARVGRRSAAPARGWLAGRRAGGRAGGLGSGSPPGSARRGRRRSRPGAREADRQRPEAAARALAGGQREAGAPRLRPGPASGACSPAGVRQPGSGPGYLGGGREEGDLPPLGAVHPGSLWPGLGGEWHSPGEVV